MTAEHHLLFEGYVRPGAEGAHVGGTASLIRSGDLVIVHDPGMCPGPASLLRPLAALGLAPGDVTDVVVSHHHPDHTRWMGLFEQARVHDYWAVYEGDLWLARPAEGARLGDDITLLATPGHTREDITVLVETTGGTLALTHLWWDADAVGDPRAFDLDALHEHRARVLEQAARIVPGHGAPFDVGPAVPR